MLRIARGRCGASSLPSILGTYLILAASHALAAPAAPTPPTLDHIFPVAVQVGTTTSITAVGKFAPWPVQAWTSAPGLAIRADEKAGKFAVEVSPDAPLGPHLVRLFNDSGASAPRFVIVTAQAEAAETEPNDDYTKAPAVDLLPSTINGRLNKAGDVDSYAVTLAEGQTLIASLEAFVLASPVDAVLRLVDSRGREMAMNHDNGRNSDPPLTWTPKAAGTYVVQVFGFAHPATADVRFAGSDACVYRLHLSRGPQVRYALPLGLERTKEAKRRVFGWNLGSLSGAELAVESGAFPTDASHATWRRAEFENALTLPLGDGPEWVDPRLFPNTAGLPLLAAPFAVTSRIEKPGEEGRFRFSANKDDKLVLEIHSASLGFPLDAWLAIQDAAGKELVRNDDGTTADPMLEWTAPETGHYVAVVGSVLHRGGADHLYRLSVQAAQPGFKAIVAESGFTLQPGKSVRVKITAQRVRGFNAKLTASVVGLPEGVTASPVELGAAEKEITVELAASAAAGRFSGPIHIRLREEGSAIAYPAVHDMTATSSRNGVPQGFPHLVIRHTDQLWLTVLAAPEPKVTEGK